MFFVHGIVFFGNIFFKSIAKLVSAKRKKKKKKKKNIYIYI